MPFFGLFGPPDVEKLKEKENIQGLIKALKYEDSSDIRRDAALALGDLGDPQAVEPLIILLKDMDKRWCKWAAAEALGKIGDDRAVEPLIDALKVDRVRKQTATALGEIGDPRALEPLIAALEDKDFKVRRAAVQALGKIGDPRAVEPLIDVMEEKITRPSAVEALGKISDERAIKALISALELPIIYPSSSDRKTRKKAVQALKKIGPPAVDALTNTILSTLTNQEWRLYKASAETLEDLNWQPDENKTGAAYWIARRDWEKCVQLGAPAVTLLIAALKHPDQEIRVGAAEALGELGDDRAVTSLLDVLQRYSRGAAQALGQLGWAPDSTEEKVQYWIAKRKPEKCAEIGNESVPFLLDALKDKSLTVMEICSEALGLIGDQRATLPLIDVFQKAQDKALQVKAAQALGQIGDPRAVLPLKAVLDDVAEKMRTSAAIKDIPWKVREAVSLALGQIGDSRAVDPLIDIALQGYSREGRLSAIEALGQIGDPRAVEPLISTFQSDLKWQPATLEALREIGEPAIEPLLIALEAKTHEVRQQAANVLGAIGDERSIQPLISALEDRNKFVRRDAAQALIKMYQTGQLDPHLQELILKHRSQMIEHTDGRIGEHIDTGQKGHSCHRDHRRHRDYGIGVDFPL